MCDVNGWSFVKSSRKVPPVCQGVELEFDQHEPSCEVSEGGARVTVRSNGSRLKVEGVQSIIRLLLSPLLLMILL